ncbi:hypothetical protein PCASD_06328 [Puccinia coronata f. sp. avenae]|uniref:Uncharacterized protein n=2 Tax=Puccinia coronata f. sp. avenae TaxID=200324 RepID=A0A2N5V905_9BASI|nr:hypothetical protein PCASD_06328 [Puccinia coronata f. sp. avenae]
MLDTTNTTLSNFLNHGCYKLGSPNQAEINTALTHLIEFATFNDISDLTTWLQPLLQLTQDQRLPVSTRSTALECLITLIESRPSSSNATPSLTWLTSVFSALVTLMAEIEEDEGWSLALDDDEEDLDALYIQAEQALGRLAQENVKHALLSVLAFTGEPLAESFSLATEHIYHVLQAGFDNPHPRVIYVAMYAIAQLSSPLKITFSTKPVHQQVLSWLLRCLENGAQPRLQAFAAKALINVLWDEGFRKVEITDEMIGPILSRLISLCQSNYTDRRSLHNKIQPDALNAIGKLFASMSQQGALAFFDNTIVTLRKLMDKIDIARAASPSDGSGLDDEEIDETELKIFEAMSRLAMTSSEQRFNAEADWWAQRMTNTLELRPQGQTRILSSLARLSGGMNAERFVNHGFLAILIGRLVSMCNSKPDISISALFDESHEFDDCQWESVMIGEQTYGIKSAELADKELAVKTLILLANPIGAWLIPHCEKIVAAVIPLLKFYFSNEVQESAMNLLPLLVQSAKASGMSTQQLQGVLTSFCNLKCRAIRFGQCGGQLTDDVGGVCGIPGARGGRSMADDGSVLRADPTRDGGREWWGRRGGGVGRQELGTGIRRLFTGISRVLRMSIGVDPEWMWTPPPPAPSWSRKWASMCWADSTTLTNAPEALRRLSWVYLQLTRSSPACSFLPPAHSPPALCEATQVARENCVSALAKIIRNPEGLVIDVDAILPLWIDALPIEIDVEEVEPSYGLLLELIARKAGMGRIEQVIHALLAVIGNETIAQESRHSLAVALRAYLAQLPPHIVELKNQGQLPPDAVWACLDAFLATNSS